jgi:predicted kinase
MTKMILVRGLPGSGKSTIAKNLIGWYWHLETDQYWMKDGEYEFDASKLGVAHQWCQDETRSLLSRGFSAVVSNTFTTKKELRPYFEIAKEFDIVPQVILCQAQYGNIHNVPEETLRKMKARFDYNIDDLYEEYEIFN